MNFLKNAICFCAYLRYISLKSSFKPTAIPTLKMFFMFGVLAVLMTGACTKTPTSEIALDLPENLNTSAREEEEHTYSYFIDEASTTPEAFATADSNYFRHYVITVVNNQPHSDCHVFTTQQKYETWGEQNGFKVAEMNQIEARLFFVADSASIIPIEESETYSPPSWYEEYQEDLMAPLASTSSAVLCMIGGRLSKHMCNPDLPPGIPWNCSGQSANLTLWYPAPIGVPALTLMNNKASAWLPQKTLLCVRPNYGHFRGWDKWFFRRRIGTITVDLDALAALPSGLFVPFNGIYSSFNDRVSSFTQWGSNNP